MNRNALALILVAGLAAAARAQAVDEQPAAQPEPAAVPAPTPAPQQSQPGKPAEPEGIIDPAAKEKLEKACTALKDAKSLSFKFKFYADGDSKDLVGVSEATVLAARDANGAWAYRLTGKGQRTGKSPAQNFDIAMFGSTAEWTDAEAKKLFAKPAGQMKGKAVEGSSILSRVLKEVLGATPLADENRAKNLSLKEDEKVDSIDCVVVLATGLPAAASMRGGELSISIAKSDNLLRKIVRETSTSRGTTRMIYEFTDVKLNDPAATIDAVHVPLPEGFTREEQAPPPKPPVPMPKPSDGEANGDSPKASPVPGAETGATPGAETTETTPAPTPAPRPVLATLPELDLKDADGKKVSTSTFKGTPAVLVFWGSWSLSSRKALHDVESLASELGDKVKVYAIAVRQKDTADAFKVAKEASLSKAAPLADGDKLAEQLHIAGYPSIVIVAADGSIFRHPISGKPADVLAAARSDLSEMLNLPGISTKATSPIKADKSEPGKEIQVPKPPEQSAPANSPD